MDVGSAFDGALPLQAEPIIRGSRSRLRTSRMLVMLRLKPGQYWEPATGRVANCYGCRTPPKAAEVTPAPTEATADKP